MAAAAPLAPMFSAKARAIRITSASINRFSLSHHIVAKKEPPQVYLKGAHSSALLLSLGDYVDIGISSLG